MVLGIILLGVIATLGILTFIWYITLSGVRSVIQYIETQDERYGKLVSSLARKEPVIVDPVPTIEKMGEVIAKLQGFGPGTQSDATDLAAEHNGMGGIGTEEETYRPGFEADPWLAKWNLDKINQANTIIPDLENSVGPPLSTDHEP